MMLTVNSGVWYILDPTDPTRLLGRHFKQLLEFYMDELNTGSYKPIMRYNEE